MRKRVLTVGILSREQMKLRTIAIARGEYRPKRSEPKVWFTSLKSLSQVLSEENTLLLELIKKSKPESISELAERAKRARENVSRTLHLMERYNLIRWEEGRHGAKAPRVTYDRLELKTPIFDLSQDVSGHSAIA